MMQPPNVNNSLLKVLDIQPELVPHGGPGSQKLFSWNEIFLS